MPPAPGATAFSVVVTVVDGGAALERCLTALTAQDVPLDIIVPVDATAAAAAAVARRFPAVRVVELGELATGHPAHSPGGQHELFDRRRAAGLAAATGHLVAIVEDRGVPDPGWARAFQALHDRLPNQVIGGAVALGRSALLNRAVFACDFARYAPPFEPGPRGYVTDVNVCYKRAALEQTRELWRERYHETTVHWALQRDGQSLYLAAEPVVRQHRDGLALGALLRERFAWGRLFAMTRARESPLEARLLRIATAPLLPLVMWARMVPGAARRGELAALLAATPAIWALLGAWAAGEAAGYATARG